MEISTSLEGIGVEELAGPFFVGWPSPPSPEVHLRILERSDVVVLALDEAGQVLGFATALTDGVLNAHISLLEVVPEHQGKGIGSSLVESLLEELGPLYAVDALTETETVPFYQGLGFVGATGVARRNYSMQSGRVG